MKAVRVFKKVSDGSIVWYHEVIAPEEIIPVFPTTEAQDLQEIPSKMPDGETALGGVPADFYCEVITNENEFPAELGILML